MDVDAVSARIDELMCREFELSPEDLADHASLRDDLDLDSLDGMDLVVVVEKEFAIRLDEKEMRVLETMGDVRRYIKRVLQEQRAAS